MRTLKTSLPLFLSLLLSLLALFVAGAASAQTVTSYNNFDTATVGSAPSGWTQINAPVTSPIVVVSGSTLSAPNALSTASTSDGQTILNTALTPVADGAVQCSCLSDPSNATGLILRSDSAGANYYVAFLQSNTLVWYKRVGGTFVSLGTPTLGTSFTTGQKIRCKFQVQGSTLSYKAWAYAGTEPGAYQVTLTDTSITTAGIAGVRFSIGSLANPLPVSDDWFTGTAGIGAFVIPGQSFTVSPASLTSGTSGNTLTLTGTGTAWTSGTTFSVSSTGTGASITAQSVNAGTQVATLTVTAGTAGTITYADSTDSATATQTVAQAVAATSAPISIVMTDTNLLVGRSPYVWSGGKMLTAGAYLKAGFTFGGTGALTLNLDTSTYGGVPDASRPGLAWTVDGGPRQTLNLTAANLTGTAPNQSVTLGTGIGAGAHSLQLWCKGIDPHYDQWATPVEVVTIASFGVPAGTTTTAPVLLTGRAYFRGDSITDGEGLISVIGSPSWADSGDAPLAWPGLVAGGLSSEYGQQGYGGLSWTGPSAGGVPALPASWQFYSSGVSRLSAGLLAPAPAYVFTNMGTNGNTTGTLATSGGTGTVRADMAALRAAAGTGSLDIYLVPFGQFAKAGLLNDLSYYGGGATASNGYSTLSVGTSTVYRALSDTNTWVIDLGTTASAGVIGGGAATFTSFDGVHPNQATDARIAGMILQSVQAVQGGQAISAAPLTLTVAAGVSSEVLTWTADSGAVNGYEVDWKPSSVLPVAGQVKSIVAVVGTGVLTWTDTSAYRLSQSGRYNVVALH